MVKSERYFGKSGGQFALAPPRSKFWGNSSLVRVLPRFTPQRAAVRSASLIHCSGYRVYGNIFIFLYSP